MRIFFNSHINTHSVPTIPHLNLKNDSDVSINIAWKRCLTIIHVYIFY